VTTDRILTIAAIAWILLVVVYLALVGVPTAGAAPIWGTDDVICGVWTYYAPGVAERAQDIHGVPDCAECAGLAVTVNQALLGRRIDIRHGREWRGPYLVVDVGSGTHRPHLVGEVAFEVAADWGISAPWWTCYKGA
jgi:hypothetical protein